MPGPIVPQPLTWPTPEVGVEALREVFQGVVLLVARAGLAELVGDLGTTEKGMTFDWCVSEGSFDAVETTRRVIGSYLRALG